jgi:hypothetical protein
MAEHQKLEKEMPVLDSIPEYRMRSGRVCLYKASQLPARWFRNTALSSTIEFSGLWLNLPSW